MLKVRTTQILPDGISSYNRRVSKNFFESLGYDCLSSRYSTRYKQGLKKKEMQIDVSRKTLQEKYGQNDVLRFYGGEKAATCLRYRALNS